MQRSLLLLGTSLILLLAPGCGDSGGDSESETASETGDGDGDPTGDGDGDPTGDGDGDPTGDGDGDPTGDGDGDPTGDGDGDPTGDGDGDPTGDGDGDGDGDPTGDGDGDPGGDASIPAAGWTFGECIGPCVGELTIGDDDALTFTIETWAAEIVGQNTGTLTPSGRMELDAAAAALIGVALDEVYGCPDCADGGASRIDLVREGMASSHAYEYFEPPGVLVDADALVTELMAALRECSQSDLLTLANDCAPIN